MRVNKPGSTALALWVRLLLHRSLALHSDTVEILALPNPGVLGLRGVGGHCRAVRHQPTRTRNDHPEACCPKRAVAMAPAAKHLATDVGGNHKLGVEC